jgi:hypothetical protein
LKECKNTPYFLVFVVPALVLVYASVLFLEYFRQDRVAPLTEINEREASESTDMGIPIPGFLAIRNQPQRTIAVPELQNIQNIVNTSQNVHSTAWHVRESDQAAANLDPAAKKSKDLARLVIRTGGVTFLTFLIIGMVGYVVYNFNYFWFVTMLVKMGCLCTNLPWYWISMDDNIRTSTDKMMKKVVNIFFCHLT